MCGCVAERVAAGKGCATSTWCDASIMGKYGVACAAEAVLLGTDRGQLCIVQLQAVLKTIEI